jgi:hypothetical protein
MIYQVEYFLKNLQSEEIESLGVSPRGFGDLGERLTPVTLLKAPNYAERRKIPSLSPMRCGGNCCWHGDVASAVVRSCEKNSPIGLCFGSPGCLLYIQRSVPLPPLRAPFAWSTFQTIRPEDLISPRDQNGIGRGAYGIPHPLACRAR